MTKHTPGPWRLIDDAQGPCMVMHPTRPGVAIASLTDAHTPLGRFVEIESPGAPERTANAHLIASAPDLAGALEKARAALLLVGRVEIVRGEARYYTSGQCLIHQDQIRDCGTACVEAEAALRKAGRL